MLDPLGGKDFRKGYNLLRPLGTTVLFGEDQSQLSHVCSDCFCAQALQIFLLKTRVISTLPNRFV